MAPIDEDDVLGRQLKALPPPRAPRTLLPRVMAAVERPTPQPHARPWFTWRLEWQIASVAVATLLLVGVAFVIASPATVIRTGAQLVAGTTPAALSGLESAASFFDVARTLWRALLEPILYYLLIWIVIMSTACAAFGAALGRVALGEVTR
jgi:hypothetical protein